jgi:ribosomal protein L29
MSKKISYKGKKDDELHKILKDKRGALLDFRLAVAGSKAKNLKEGKALRKDIARAMTELNSKKVA